MTAPASTHPRKKLFINPTIQGRTLAHVAFYWGAYHLVLWHVMFLYRYVQYRGELLAGARPQSFNELYSQFTLEHYAVIVCAVCIFPLVFWDVLKLTHRVVGPLVRFRHCLKLLARGERVTQVRIRKGDFLVDLQNSFNEFLASPFNPTVPTPVAQSQPDPHDAAEDDEHLLEDLRKVQETFWQPYTPPEPAPLVVDTPAPQHSESAV